MADQTLGMGFDPSRLPKQIVIDYDASPEQWRRLHRAFERIGEGMSPHDSRKLYYGGFG